MAALVNPASKIEHLQLTVEIPTDPTQPSLAATVVPVALTSYSAAQATIWIGTPTLQGATAPLSTFGGLVATFPSASSTLPPATSHLIGSPDDSDETTAAQMSQRISRKTGWPICLSFSNYAALSAGESDIASAGIILGLIEKRIVATIADIKSQASLSSLSLSNDNNKA
jgi:hypothetical protein